MTDTTHEAPDDLMTRLKDRLKSLYDDPREYSPGQISEASVMALTRIKELEAKLAQQDDLVQAAVAAKLREAAEALNERGSREQEDFGLVRGTQNFFRARDIVLDLITPDAQAALDRVVAEQREKDAKVAEGYFGCEAIAAAIREGGKTNYD